MHLYKYYFMCLVFIHHRCLQYIMCFVVFENLNIMFDQMMANTAKTQQQRDF